MFLLLAYAPTPLRFPWHRAQKPGDTSLVLQGAGNSRGQFLRRRHQGIAGRYGLLQGAPGGGDLGPKACGLLPQRRAERVRARITTHLRTAAVAPPVPLPGLAAGLGGYGACRRLDGVAAHYGPNADQRPAVAALVDGGGSAATPR